MSLDHCVDLRQSFFYTLLLVVLAECFQQVNCYLLFYVDHCRSNDVIFVDLNEKLVSCGKSQLNLLRWTCVGGI